MTDAVKQAPTLSVNRLAWPIAQRLIDTREQLSIATSRDTIGVLIIDAGIEVRAGLGVGASLRRDVAIVEREERHAELLDELEGGVQLRPSGLPRMSHTPRTS